MENKKNTILLYLCIAIFGVLGVYLTFIAGNTNKYDSQVRAYKIDPNEHYDSDDAIIYNPIYYFKIDGREYECEAKSGSSSYHKEKKNIVYYDSSDPTKCLTEYEKSTSRLGGIICLIATALMIYFFIIKKPSNDLGDYNQVTEYNTGGHYPNEEDAEKVIGIISKFQLIYKRVILGIIIIILFILTLIDTSILKQTIKAKNYVETTAVYALKKEDNESTVFDDYIYTFKDKNGREHEITISLSKDETAKEEIKIKYNENNPDDYYEEGATFDKSGFIWYIVKIVAMILLIVLFFNKKLLSKINMSAGVSKN